MTIAVTWRHGIITHLQNNTYMYFTSLSKLIAHFITRCTIASAKRDTPSGMPSLEINGSFLDQCTFTYYIISPFYLIRASSIILTIEYCILVIKRGCFTSMKTAGICSWVLFPVAWLSQVSMHMRHTKWYESQENYSCSFRINSLQKKQFLKL